VIVLIWTCAVLSKIRYGGTIVEIGGGFTTCHHNMAAAMWVLQLFFHHSFLPRNEDG